MTIGGAKAWSLSEAQSEARRLQTLIDAGTDPRQAKAEKIAKAEAAKEQAKVEAMRNSISVQQAWTEYVQKNSPRWSHHHVIDHAKVSAPGGQPKKRGPGLTVQGVLYPLLRMRMVDVNADVLAAWKAQEAEIRGTAARHGFVLFRTFWNWCAEHKAYQSIIDRQAITKAVRDNVPKAGTKKTTYCTAAT